MDQAALARCLHLLTLPVPSPTAPAAKPQKSWATLHPGQHLASRAPLYLATTLLPTSSVWEVVGVSSQGARLALVQPRLLLSPTPTFLLRTRDWKGKMFDRVQRPAKGRNLRA